MTPTTPRQLVLLNLARKLEHVCSLIEEDAECSPNTCEATALDAITVRVEQLAKHVESEIASILSAQGDNTI